VESEQEADLIALEILKLSNINLERARNVIVRMVRESSDNNRSSFSDTHPTGVERLAAFDQAAKKPSIYSLDTNIDEKKVFSQERYLKAYFNKVVGSYCVYVGEGEKFPIPSIHGCPPIKYFKR
jgi:predicted Zn-dependent protease